MKRKGKEAKICGRAREKDHDGSRNKIRKNWDDSSDGENE